MRSSKILFEDSFRDSPAVKSDERSFNIPIRVSTVDPNRLPDTRDNDPVITGLEVMD